MTESQMIWAKYAIAIFTRIAETAPHSTTPDVLVDETIRLANKLTEANQKV